MSAQVCCPPLDQRAAKECSEDALIALVGQYSSLLCRAAYAVLHSEADAEDLVGEAFLRLLRHQDELDKLENPRAWLITMIRRMAIDKIRRAKTRPQGDDLTGYLRVLRSPAREPDEAAIAHERYNYVLSLVTRLPAKERTALKLSTVGDLSISETASVLNTTPSAVRSRIHRARKMLAALITADSAR